MPPNTSQTLRAFNPMPAARQRAYFRSGEAELRNKNLAHPRPLANTRVCQSALRCEFFRAPMCAFCSGAVQKVAQAAISRLRRSNRSERL